MWFLSLLWTICGSSANFTTDESYDIFYDIMSTTTTSHHTPHHRYTTKPEEISTVHSSTTFVNRSVAAVSFNPRAVMFCYALSREREIRKLLQQNRSFVDLSFPVASLRDSPVKWCAAGSQYLCTLEDAPKGRSPFVEACRALRRAAAGSNEFTLIFAETFKWNIIYSDNTNIGLYEGGGILRELLLDNVHQKFLSVWQTFLNSSNTSDEDKLNAPQSQVYYTEATAHELSAPQAHVYRTESTVQTFRYPDTLKGIQERLKPSRASVSWVYYLRLAIVCLMLIVSLSIMAVGFVKKLREKKK